MTERILRGAGNASFLAYRSTPMIGCESLVHGMTRSGQLVVATCPGPDDPLAAMDCDCSYSIRMDITKESPEPEFRLIAATVHLLGELEWQSEAATAELVASGDLPEHVSFIASAVNGRLGIVATERCLIHDSGGVRSFGFDVLAQRNDAPVFPSANEELDVHHMVMLLNEDTLRGIRDSVLKGSLCGRLCSRQSVLGGCPHTWDSVMCADVDCTGITMLTIEPTETYSVFAAFEREAHSLDELNEEVWRLVEATLVTERSQ